MFTYECFHSPGISALGVWAAPNTCWAPLLKICCAAGTFSPAHVSSLCVCVRYQWDTCLNKPDFEQDFDHWSVCGQSVVCVCGQLCWLTLWFPHSGMEHVDGCVYAAVRPSVWKRGCVLSSLWKHGLWVYKHRSEECVLLHQPYPPLHLSPEKHLE